MSKKIDQKELSLIIDAVNPVKSSLFELMYKLEEIVLRGKRRR